MDFWDAITLKVKRTKVTIREKTTLTHDDAHVSASTAQLLSLSLEPAVGTHCSTDWKHLSSQGKRPLPRTTHSSPERPGSKLQEGLQEQAKTSRKS